MTSLQRRLHVGLAASLTVLMLLLWFLVSSAIERLTDEFLVERLSHDGQSLLAALQPAADGALMLGPGYAAEIYERAFSGHYFLIRLADGEVLRSRSLWDEDLSIAALAVGEQRRWHAPGPAGQELLVWAGGFRKQGQALTLAVAEDISPLSRQLARFAWSFAALTALILIALLLVQRLVVRRSLQSLERVREDIQRLEHGQTEQLAEDVPSEVRPLVREVNHLLALLAQRLLRSRNALGNLAHAIKTPLSLLVRAADRAPPPLAEELRQYGEQIRQLTERELKRARLAGRAAPGQRFAPADELQALADVLRRIYPDKRVAVHCALSPDAQFVADRDDLLELIGNLLDNACKWAKARVDCRVSDERGLSVVVEDDGPGCSGEALDRLTTRGVRIDESVGGHGLGLAIVRDIVELYGGELRFAESAALGGLRVEVSLPVARAQ